MNLGKYKCLLVTLQAVPSLLHDFLHTDYHKKMESRLISKTDTFGYLQPTTSKTLPSD